MLLPWTIFFFCPRYWNIILSCIDYAIMLIIYRLTSHFKCYFTVRVGDAILHLIIKWTAILQQQQGGRTNQCRQIQNPDYCKEKFHSSRGLTPAQLDLDFIAESGEHRNSCGKCYYRLIQHGSWITSVSFEEAKLVSLGEEKPLRGLLWHFHTFALTIRPAIKTLMLQNY